MDTEYKMMYDSDITVAVRKIQESGSKIKAEIFKSLVMNKEFDKSAVSIYLNSVNGILKYWNDYAMDLQNKMRETKGELEGIRSIEYDIVKGFVYSKYDYASIVQFVDGLMKGTDDEKWKKTEDIEDFKDHTLSKAFDDRDTTVGGLLDEVINTGNESFSISSKYEGRMFQNIANYKDLFNNRDRIEIYQSIAKTIDFVLNNMNTYKLTLDYNKVRLFVSMINNIVEYMTYCIVAYCTRIFFIQKYAYPFIYSYKASKSDTLVKESVDSKYTSEIRIMRDVNDIDFRDVGKYEELLKKLRDFLDAIGMDSNANNIAYSGYLTADEVAKNKFSKGLSNNELIRILSMGRPFHSELGRDGRITELNNNLNSFVYNKYQTMEGTSTPRHEILHIIRGTEYENTIKGYQDLSVDLYVFSMYLLRQIKDMIEDANWFKDRTRLSLTTNNEVNEIIKACTDIYKEVVMAIIEKARNIEVKLNNLNTASAEETINQFKIKVPGENRNNISDGLRNAVPDTTRMPIDILDTYALPAFESMEMYDYYLRSLPIFEDNLYLSEGVNISEIMNKIFAKLKSLVDSMTQFFKNEGLKRAAEWVKNHEEELISMNFSGQKMKVLPYKDIELKNSGINKLYDYTFKAEVLDSVDSVNNFIKNLYPTEGIYNWFNSSNSNNENNKDPKKNKQSSASIRYSNAILFQDQNSATDEPVQPIEISGNDINKYLRDWIETVKSYDIVYQGFLNYNKKITDATTNIKNEIAKIKKEDTSSNNNQSTSTNNQQQESSTNNQQNNSQQNDAQQNGSTPHTEAADNTVESKSSNAELLVSQLELAILRLWTPYIKIFQDYTRNQYSYIKEAYSLGKK